MWTYKFKQHKDVKDKVIEMITKYSVKSGDFDKNSGTHMYSDYFIKDGNRELMVKNSFLFCKTSCSNSWKGLGVEMLDIFIGVNNMYREDNIPGTIIRIVL